MSTVSWTEDHTLRTARWHSENGASAPDSIVVVNDATTADTACRSARAGTGLLWRGDFHNARQLLRAMGRRVERQAPLDDDPAEAFRRYRASRRRRAQVLGKLLVLLEDDHSLALRRAPDVRRACTEAYGAPQGSTVIPLTGLLGVLGAAQWREKGVYVPALDDRIHAHYGVFSPVRGEYVDLVAAAPLPARADIAFDLGTGTGVLAALLARRGYSRITATDNSLRALACARANLDRLGLSSVDVHGPALFPDGEADLIVCNPPWLPGTPTSALESGVYDENSSMLHDYLSGLRAHLRPGGEGWLILSDLPEHLGLRTRSELLARITTAGLHITARLDTRPTHTRATDPNSPFATARAAETTSLYRLVPR
ncbi:class I SAM-dependent methyltransferase [Nocardia abscessus]|uniref:class I SAM-dependent methyltransferase n=1 Tax=Nocardia abscessus TaxID=120957 RepID=UPI00245606CE|nr:class I SAM-dependent methyltransferase [Nocardia abscessus]